MRVRTLQAVFQGSFAVRPLSGAAAGASSKPEEGGKGGRGGKEGGKGALAVEQEGFDAITDQIPQRPMGVVEGTSYTLLIAAGIAIAGGGAAPTWRLLHAPATLWSACLLVHALSAKLAQLGAGQW